MILKLNQEKVILFFHTEYEKIIAEINIFLGCHQPLDDSTMIILSS
jgi:hypothetical protein